MSEWRGLVSFFLFSFFFSLSLSFFLTSRSAVGWWDVWDGGVCGEGEEEEVGRYVGMYVCVCTYDGFPVFFFFFFFLLSFLFTLFLSLSYSLSRRSRRLQKRGWIGGWAGWTGVTARGVKPFRLSRGTFDLDLPGVVGTVSESFFVNGTVNPTCSLIGESNQGGGRGRQK